MTNHPAKTSFFIGRVGVHVQKAMGYLLERADATKLLMDSPALSLIRIV